jgi:hypothetical protein
MGGAATPLPSTNRRASVVADRYTNEIKRGTFAATFLVAGLVAICIEAVKLEDI